MRHSKSGCGFSLAVVLGRREFVWVFALRGAWVVALIYHFMSFSLLIAMRNKQRVYIAFPFAFISHLPPTGAPD